MFVCVQGNIKLFVLADIWSCSGSLAAWKPLAFGTLPWRLIYGATQHKKKKRKKQPSFIIYSLKTHVNMSIPPHRLPPDGQSFCWREPVCSEEAVQHHSNTQHQRSIHQPPHHPSTLPPSPPPPSHHPFGDSFLSERWHRLPRVGAQRKTNSCFIFLL